MLHRLTDWGYGQMNRTQGNTLYLECNTGISGDMMVAALLDLGADQKVLEQVLESLPLSGFQVKISRVKKAGLDVCDFHVVLEEENHDHDMEYLYGHAHEEHHHSQKAHMHEQDETHHTHEQDETHHTHEGHHHTHRGMADILHIIEHASLTPGAKALAERIFQILAKAESKAHGVPVEEVHFHEVGAIDSIVDVIAAAVCLDNLGIERCMIPYLSEGKGDIRCQHGILPVPVPAVLNIVDEHGLSLRITDTKGELVTPTGAAIAAAICTSDRLPEEFVVRAVGMGAGKRAYERPSILRAMLIEEKEKKNPTDMICKLESNIDDCSGEMLGFVMEQLFLAGAKDVYYTPVYMKKNRPACQLNVIAAKEDIAVLEDIIFAQTTTIGIRRQYMERTVLKRHNITVDTEFGKAQVKVCENKGKVRYYPEYESVAALCRQSGRAYPEVCRIVQEAAGKKQQDENEQSVKENG